jgi:alkanesulfonate monooxygenase SsuD/methylene tetrahydromethanopterin reductase-like flavin-dependent oxidoreductase (luciferase family)
VFRVMRFDASLFWHPFVPIPWPTQVAENREYAQALEQLGFSTAWSCEHHLWHDRNWACTPNSVLTSLDVANHTTNLRVGQSPVSIVDRHPIHVAEDIAVLDNMTEGRVDFGAARGFNVRWGAQFNPDADRRDDHTNRALFEESLEIILRAWTEEAFSYSGRFYTIPVPGWTETDPSVKIEAPYYNAAGELVAINVLPKPYQTPYPPVWLMVGSNQSWAFAGAKGVGALGGARSPAAIGEAVSYYRNAAAELQGTHATLGHNVGVQFVTYCAKTMEEATGDVRDGINRHFAPFEVGRKALEARRRSVLGSRTITADDLNMEPFDFELKHGTLMVGTPDDVSERIARFREEARLQNFQLFPSIPGVSFAEAMRSLELFGTEVIPRFSGVVVA